MKSTFATALLLCAAKLAAAAHHCGCNLGWCNLGDSPEDLTLPITIGVKLRNVDKVIETA